MTPTKREAHEFIIYYNIKNLNALPRLQTLLNSAEQRGRKKEVEKNKKCLLEILVKEPCCCAIKKPCGPCIAKAVYREETK